MDGEPIQTWTCRDVQLVQRWHHDPRNPHGQRWVTVGTIDGGRWWFVENVGPPAAGAWAFQAEAPARQAAERLMAETAPWVEVPAAYDSRQQPATPGPWIKVGSTWRRP